VNHEISRVRERIEKENLLSNGSLLWSATLLDWLFPLVRHGLGGFFLWRSRERRREVMEVYESGFTEYQGGYFISCESTLGVMTGWRTLMEYQTAGFSPRMRRVFHWTVFMAPEWGFSVDFMPRG
jgi:hypothetical protein